MSNIILSSTLSFFYICLSVSPSVSSICDVFYGVLSSRCEMLIRSQLTEQVTMTTAAAAAAAQSVMGV